LAAAIDQVLDDQLRKNAELTYEEWRAKMTRRVTRQQRERQRAARLANAAVSKR
jgi:hypothetical protein